MNIVSTADLRRTCFNGVGTIVPTLEGELADQISLSLHCETAEIMRAYTKLVEEEGKLTGLEATLFSLYPSLEKLSVQGILPTGQTAAELTPSANKLGW